MLTIACYKNEKQVGSYFEEHLSSGEYHAEKGVSIGKWDGKTCEHLGIEAGSDVQLKVFSDLVKGINPSTGKSFLIRKKSNRIIAREMLFSAPKSVSILAITMGDHRLQEAHAVAVNEAFKELECLSQSKVRLGLPVRSDQKRTTGNIIAARFTHQTSRALDPQLHTHNVVFNVTYDQVEKRLKALDPDVIYNSTPYLSEVYRSVLAFEVRRLGYEIEQGKHTFRIKEMSLEIENLYSKRSSQIDKAAEKLLSAKGVEVDKRGRALLAGLTRRAKDHDVSESDYLKYQRSQLTKAQEKSLNDLVERSKINAGSPSFGAEKEDPKQIAKSSIDYALEHVFERASVVHKRDLIKEALKHAAGKAILMHVEKELMDPRFIRRGDWVMTREERDREVRILDYIREGKRGFAPIMSDVTKFDSNLEEDQVKALQTIGSSLDRFVLLRGVAGSGKTFALTEIKNKSANEKILFLAPSGSATETLRTEGFENAITLQMFLKSDFVKNSAKDALIVVDEAGLISTKQMDQFLSIVKEKNARVIFVGDTLQHNSVEGGDALRLIEDYSIIEKATLSKVRRQRKDIYKSAVQLLSQGEVVKGFEKLEKIDAIKEIKGNKRHVEVAKDYVDSIKDNKKTLIVAPTHKEIELINKKVREVLKQEGLISKEEHEFNVIKSANFTAAQKAYAGNYEVGQSVSFHKSKGVFRQGEVWEVLRSNGDRVLVNHKEKGEREIEPKLLAKKYDVVISETKSFSQGDKIIVKANFATGPFNRIKNGTIGEIDKINDDGSLMLRNGKVLGKDFRQFNHAYAITSQSSQGKTADKVILSLSSGSGMALSKNQFYVSASRGRDEISIYTDDKEKLKNSVIRSSARKLVIEELVRDRIILRAAKKVELEISRAVEKSKDLIEKHFVKSRDRLLNKEIEMKKNPKLEREVDYANRN